MDILLLLVLYVALPLVTAVMLGMWIFSKYRDAIEKLQREPFWEKARPYTRSKIIVFLYLLAPAVIYGILFIIFYMMAPQADAPQGRIALTGGYILGSAGVISLIAQGLLISKGVADIPQDAKINMKMPTDFEKRNEWMRKNKKAMKKYTFPKHLVVAVMPQCIAVFAFLITLFLFMGVGLWGASREVDADASSSNKTVIDNEFAINATNVDEAETIGLIFAASCVPSLLAGYLPYQVEGEIYEKRIFTKKLMLSAVGILPAVIGLVIAITMMVLNGMIGG